MKKIYILWLALDLPVSWSGHAGGQTFNYYFKAFRDDERFDVRLIALSDGEPEQKVNNEFIGIKHDIVYYKQCSKLKKIANIESKYNLFNRHAGLISNFCCSEILKIAKSYKANNYAPHVIILEWTHIVVLAKELSKIFPKSKIIASEHDVTFVWYKRKSKSYKGLKRIFWDMKYKQEKRIELDSLRRCKLVLPHNADNKEVLINNGIAREKIQGLVPYFNNMVQYQRCSNRRDILFFGAMSRPENYMSAIWFIEKVMPLIEDMNIRFVILGSNPPDKLKKLESEKVFITGYVDSIEPYFQQSMCLVAPLVLGAGIKVKVLEALSSGIPVLTNEIGIEGIPAVSGRDYFYCTEPKEYAEIIRRLKQGNINENLLCENAKDFMRTHFSIEDSLNIYKDKVLKIGEKE